MKHFIILDYYHDNKDKVSVPIEDITRIFGTGNRTDVYYGAEGKYIEVSNSVQEVVKRINEVINNLNKIRI